MTTPRVMLYSEDDGTLIKEWIAPTPVSIGRGPSWSPASAQPDSGSFRSPLTKSMSQSHAKLSWKDNTPFIEDCNSTNGTWIETGSIKDRVQDEAVEVCALVSGAA